MDTTSSPNYKAKRTLVNILSIFAILAFALPVTTVAQAATNSPFIGHWQAIDVDGSDIRLTIAGRPSGPFQITWTESYISFCNREAGIVRGTGWLNAGDANLLEADLHLECFTTGASLDFPLAWRYHPATNLLSSRYENGMVTIWHQPGRLPPPPPTLNLRVNYGHDWVESFYEGGHMAWITVTESDGITVKASAELLTEPKDYWGGQTGFQSLDSVWSDADGNPMQNPPDIQPNDWVFGWADNGASAQVQIGDISGRINLAADSIQGTIMAPWFTVPVSVECLDWGSGRVPFSNKDGGSILTNGANSYSCSWAGEWDIQPGQTVGVGYSGPDGNWVANAFDAPNPRIYASEVGDWFWVTGFYPGQLDLSIYESADEGAKLLWSGHQEATDLWGITAVGSDVHGQDLLPGNYVVVSDGVNEKGLVLEAITVDIFDVKYDFMSGTAPAGRDVRVAAGPQEWQTGMWVTANPNTGAWTADFTTIPFDITEDMQPWSYAQIFDADGDANEADPPPLELWANAYTYDLPAGYWSEGEHNYHFEAEWNGGSETTNEILFNVSDQAQPYDRYVLLRPGGVRAGPDCGAVDAIRPDQPTRFLAGYVTDYPMTYSEALAYFDSLSARAFWDGGESAGLAPHEIIPFNSDDWFQYVCTYTEAPWRDEFSSETLAPIWYWKNGDSGKWSLTEQPGFLRIYASNTPTSDGNLLLRPVAQGDFRIETRVLFEPNTDFQFAGLVIYQDGGNLLQFGRAFCDLGTPICVGNGIYFDKILGGNFTDSNFATPVGSPSEAYLRLERHGNMVTAFYSGDGISWVEIGMHEIPSGFQINGVGLTASQDYSVVGIPADFDFFEFSGSQ